MFWNYKKMFIYTLVLFLIFTTASCTMPTLKAVSYQDSVYKLTDSEENRFTYTNSINEKIICTFNSNLFTYNSFNFELNNDIYKVTLFSNSIRIVFPSERVVTASFNSKNEINVLSAANSYPIYESDHEIVRLAQNIYAARGVKYFGWSYVLIVAGIFIIGIIIIKIYSNRNNNYNKNVRSKAYYGNQNYKRNKSYYNNNYYKNRNVKHNVYANTNRKWYNKEAKHKSNKAIYYIIVNLFILILIGILIYMVLYM